MGDGQIELVQLRELVPGEQGLRQGKVLTGRPSGVRRFFKQLQINDAEAIAFGEQTITVGVRDFLHQAFGPKFGDLVAQGGEPVLGRRQAQGLGDLRVKFTGGQGPPGRQARSAPRLA